MLKLVALVIVAAVVAVLVAAAFRPAAFRIERSVLVAAPPEAVLAEISDFRVWRAWSPFEAADPGLTRRFSGPERGVGAVYAWSGRKIGEGRMEIVSADARQVRIALDFLKPMKSSNQAVFSAEPLDGGLTRVTWAMSGASPYPARLIGLVVDMDKMLGGDFDTGLSNLKTVVERRQGSRS